MLRTSVLVKFLIMRVDSQFDISAVTTNLYNECSMDPDFNKGRKGIKNEKHQGNYNRM